MTNKSVIAACLFAALNICTLSARAEAVAPQTYTYGTHLDIQKVLSMKEDQSMTCGIVDARMNRRTRNGWRNFIRVTVSSARAITVRKVIHGPGAMMYRHSATTFHAAGKPTK